jgi:hypothetical protein
MFTADWLSALDRRFHLTNRARPRRRRASRRLWVTAEVSLLEDRCLMSRTVPHTHPRVERLTTPPASGVIVMPASNVSAPGDVMYQNPHLKTMVIYNNTDSTVFPILEGENSATTVQDPGDKSNVLPTYDHRESGIRPNNRFGWNEEYRAYVGYTGTDGVNYLGLPAHTSVTVPVPMAIWDSGRLNIVEDTQSTEDLLLNSSIPFTYDSSALQYAESIAKLQTRPGNIQNAMLLLYHSGTALGINSDAPSQLVEFTIRDPSVPVPDTKASFDYDISYLDALYLPVALEADTGTRPGVGYVGTTLSVAQFEASVNAFTNGTWLDGYLGPGKGWPQYYLSNPTGPTDPSDPVKIPGGHNIFAESVNASSYNVLHSTLTSSQATANLPSTSDNYAVSAMTNLWFSWAKYYQQNNPGATPTPVLQMLMSQPNVQTFPIKTDPDNPGDLARANAFSKIVWDVMNEFSADPNLNPQLPLLPTSQLLQFIIGDNVADLPNLDKEQQQAFTNQVILLMRGVPSDSYSQSSWYPAPGDPTTAGVAKYNLNPFVWFVHNPKNWYGQRIYAYAYSVDDAYGNILVNDASQLLVTIGGPDGLINTNPYQPLSRVGGAPRGLAHRPAR